MQKNQKIRKSATKNLTLTYMKISKRQNIDEEDRETTTKNNEVKARSVAELARKKKKNLRKLCKKK